MGELNNNFLQETLHKAEQLQRASEQYPKTPFLKRLEPLLNNKTTKFFLIKLLDTSLRPKQVQASNQHIQQIFKQYPRHLILFNSLEKTLIKLYKTVGKYLPQISIPLIKNQIRRTTASVVFTLDGEAFNKITQLRKNTQVKQNINLIGEALLGENEAEERIKAYKTLIQNPDIDYISIKISTIYSQILNLAHEETLVVLKSKLAQLYDESLRVEKETGKQTFINLDMEEYRDLSLTVDLFESLLSEPQYRRLYAGIVLQAYIPDSFHYLKRLQKWAEIRVSEGGVAPKIRIVKGANLEMEKFESSIMGWPLATHPNKSDTDTQYKRMLLECLTTQSCQSLKIGIASHNVFDIAFALNLIEQESIHASVDIEMLEGLAENYINPIKNQGVRVLLYTPVINEGQFLSAIAYLVRRFDEATADGNFLRESVNMQIKDAKWQLLQKAFEASYNNIKTINLNPKRTQNRNNPNAKLLSHFKNSPDTDWNLEVNQNWAKEIKQRWSSTTIPLPAILPTYTNEEERDSVSVENWNGTLPWKLQFATSNDYHLAIESCKKSVWNTLAPSERIKIIKQAAIELENSRADLIGVGVAEVGKLITELDPEISEAVDFANYYAQSMETLLELNDLEFTPQGINLVISPWNFPIAIPAGGILASLATGNTVILKPAKRSIACAYVLVETLWKAGIPKDALHLLPIHSNHLSSLLGEQSPFASVILTGGTDTANTLLKTNPHLNIFAETGGKNATIVTSFADKDLAIKNVIDSAFNNVGQKCSATSLLILEKEVYNDEHFLKLLVDAVKSKKVGSPWHFDNKIGPMANPIDGNLKEEINNSNTNWLLKGNQIDSFTLEPSIAYDVTINDTCFQNELFGPHLSVIKAENLQEAITIANSTDFGLTSGIESLNESEIELWKNSIQAGNLYINRSTTGAIVKRQPFGGIKLSSFGPGMKAGGKNYLTQFLNANFKTNTSDILEYAKESFHYWSETLFLQEIDEINIRGQANTTRYLKPEKVILTISDESNIQDIELVKLACTILKLKLSIYSDAKLSSLPEKDYQLITTWDEILPSINWKTRIRSLNKKSLPVSFLNVLNNQAIHVYGNRPIPHGRIELVNYLQEQSISNNYHRYGNLMDKESN